jgi:hypothetical protein
MSTPVLPGVADHHVNVGTVWHTDPYWASSRRTSSQDRFQTKDYWGFTLVSYSISW